MLRAVCSGSPWGHRVCANPSSLQQAQIWPDFSLGPSHLSCPFLQDLPGPGAIRLPLAFLVYFTLSPDSASSTFFPPPRPTSQHYLPVLLMVSYQLPFSGRTICTNFLLPTERMSMISRSAFLKETLFLAKKKYWNSLWSLLSRTTLCETVL